MSPLGMPFFSEVQLMPVPRFLFFGHGRNGHGYEVAKRFATKFTYISPVWYQLKRKPQLSATTNPPT